MGNQQVVTGDLVSRSKQSGKPVTHGLGFIQLQIWEAVMEEATGEFSQTWYSLTEQARKYSFHHMGTAEISTCGSVGNSEISGFFLHCEALQTIDIWLYMIRNRINEIWIIIKNATK